MKALLQNSLFLRIASAIILMPFVLYALIFGVWAFFAMIGIAIAISLYEWIRMVRLMDHALVRGIIGSLYIVVCFASYLAVWLVYGPGAALALILCIWASDTGAYFAGKTFKGPKLASAISPSKTWSGFVGGAVASGAAMVVYVTWMGLFLSDMRGETMYIFPQTPIWALFTIGASITFTGQIGDLIESYQKRRAGLKDSGNIIPGHGGILDRIDSLLFASPAFFLTMWFLS